jgi:hypothetical protein
MLRGAGTRSIYAKQDFNGDGAAVSYLNNDGDI